MNRKKSILETAGEQGKKQMWQEPEQRTKNKE